MANQTIPTVLEHILATDSEPDVVFATLLPALGEVLQCDRCFLYLRNPQTQMGKIVYCWCQSDRSIITQLEPKIRPLAVAYVKAANI